MGICTTGLPNQESTAWLCQSMRRCQCTTTCRRDSWQSRWWTGVLPMPPALLWLNRKSRVQACVAQEHARDACGSYTGNLRNVAMVGNSARRRTRISSQIQFWAQHLGGTLQRFHRPGGDSSKMSARISTLPQSSQSLHHAAKSLESQWTSWAARREASCLGDVMSLSPAWLRMRR